MRVLISLWCIFISFSYTFCQTNHYYPFAWENQFGIVDEGLNEVIPPIYSRDCTMVGKSYPYIILKHEDESTLVLHKISGHQEKFDQFEEKNFLAINNNYYVLASKENNSWLIQSNDFSSRLSLPNRYYQITEMDNHLLAYHKKSSNCRKLDIISKADLKVILSIDSVIAYNIYSISAVKGSLYAIQLEKGTKIFGPDFSFIGFSPENLHDLASVQAFIKDKTSFLIYLPDFFFSSAMIAAPPDKNFIKEGKSSKDKNWYYIDACISWNECSPFCKFYVNKNTSNRVVVSQYDNEIALYEILGKSRKLKFLFYSNVEKNRIYFPKKYWKKIDLKRLK